MQSLRAKLIVALLAVVAGIAVLLTAASYQRMKAEMLDGLASQSAEAAEAAVRSADDWLKAQSSSIKAMVAAADQPDPVPMLQLIKNADGFDTTYVGFADKHIVFSSPQNLPEGYDPTGRPWYQQAAAAGKPVITEPYLDASTKKLVITMATPIMDGTNTKAVAAGDVFMDGLVSGVLGVKLAHQGYAFVTDTKGQVLIHADEARRMKPATDLSPELDAARLKSLAEKGELAEMTIGGAAKFVQVRAIPSTGWYLAVVLDKGDALAPLGKLLVFSIGLLVVVIALLVPLTTVLIARMLQGLIKLRDAMRAIASGGGDLTRRIEVSGQDEIAQAAQAFNQFQEQLRQMFVELQNEASRLTEGVNAVTGITRRMAEDSRQLSDHGAANAATIEELTVSITHIADYANDANEMVEGTGQLSTEGAKSIERVSTEIDSSANVVRELSALFNEVNHRADEIGGIIKVIREIADQTNLLALNAAIEAARAGEQGRGFAVVADEVRKLAERTGSATLEISSKIDGMRGATQGAASNMKRTLDSVETGANLARETADSIAQIQERMTEVVSNMREIAHSTSEQRQAATLMAQNAERVTSQIQASDDALQSMTATLCGLDELATGIRGMFAKFRL
ncbi:MAG: methyl-accepting chemotaxis protein [Burkholderiales bacterium]|nr:methyl-accepting chemotaxis protein [Burkholderiales bacterium]